MVHINQRLMDTGSPPIPEARRWLDSYDGRMGAVLNLSQAAPGTPPPPSLLRGLSMAAADPRTASYGPIRGEPELIAAYGRHVGDVYKTDIASDEIAITAGCNEAFFVAALSVAAAGDAVLVPTPWYFNHVMTLSMLGVEPLALPTRPENGFVPDAADARRLFLARRQAGKTIPRAIVLVTPNNPTGAIYSADVIARFAALAAEFDAWLIVDETYRDFVAGSDNAPPHRLFESSHRSRLMQLYSFSKSYCIPGYRLGALIAPASHMVHVDKVLDSLQICPARAGQIAVAPEIEPLAAWRRKSAREIAARAKSFADVMMAMAGWRIDAIGAYFAYVAHPFNGVDDVAVARALARTAGVLVLPGTFFGAEAATHLRFAFANVSDASIGEIPRRLAAVVV